MKRLDALIPAQKKLVLMDSFEEKKGLNINKVQKKVNPLNHFSSLKKITLHKFGMLLVLQLSINRCLPNNNIIFRNYWIYKRQYPRLTTQNVGSNLIHFF